MFGSHLSTAGGLENALIKARELAVDCVQIFTKNQRQWAAKPLTDDQIVVILETQGIQVARRTVAKYRAMEGILPARLRHKQRSDSKSKV